MLFNSFEFIFLFLPMAVGGYHLFRSRGQIDLSHYWLIACSLLFYSWSAPRNVPVLLASLVFNYAIAQWMSVPHPATGSNQQRKQVLFAGIAGNLLFLCYYKYFKQQLPLGISFFTLMQVMYLVDCYEGLMKLARFREHALFACFFPTVSLGPILRAKDFLKQANDPNDGRLTPDQLARALLLFSIGLFKKVVIAESFARIADAGYPAAGSLSMIEAWSVSFSYCLQLYYDFSGYSDMAVGAAMALGLRIPINFNSPYQAHSIVDFWRRWHISLSNFITTYLYTATVRSFRKLTFAKAMWSTFISMVIVGIWHGSSWNYIIFGALHGVGLVVNQYWKKKKLKLPSGAAWILTIMYLNLTFVFFRAPDLLDAIAMLRSMFHFGNIFATSNLQLLIPPGDIKELMPPVVLGVVMIFLPSNSNQIVAEFQPNWKTLSFTSCTMLVALLYLNSNIGKGFSVF